ncbi:hypothetical protein Poly30_25660 [Planctomycetes bacterium Poly30]|uniref:DUF455 domain-containing protein n=1 Tax=Saltatorellus ferox TaxID=2528018 RepID=A0A518ESH6_9BACT|nr:hypothetical protein Poly30_25660 [Planctomycetes bacterium Poly30]
MASPDSAPSTSDAKTASEWCRAYVESSDVAEKLRPAPRPGDGDPSLGAERDLPRRLPGPGRAAHLRVLDRAEKIPKPGALVEASAVAKLLHVFLHHEIQAAELCAWAFLAFPEAPSEFRAGLLGILDDEVRHAALYAGRIEELGASYGDFPVRDWFWARTLTATTPLQYVALMGLGFEGGNLEHAARFEALLREAGDERSASLVGQVGREEVSHVRFAARWFSEWTHGDPTESPDFDRWRAELPPPLTPEVLRGKPLDRDRRRRAGLSESFLDRLDDFVDPLRPVRGARGKDPEVS